MLCVFSFYSYLLFCCNIGFVKDDNKFLEVWYFFNCCKFFNSGSYCCGFFVVVEN